MPEFGKRNRKAVSRAFADRLTISGPADFAGAAAVVETGKLPYWAKTSPWGLAFVMLIAAAGLWLIGPYAGGLWRDHRLAGTWQPAYDMQATDGKCRRHNFMLTFCDVTLKSLAEPDKAPVAISSMTMFSSGAGAILVPMRSKVDPSAVTVAYLAETVLMNRTLTLIVMAITVAAMFFFAVSALLRGEYVGGAAHRALLTELHTLKSHLDAPSVEQRNYT